jgi:hypothetical protein
VVLSALGLAGERRSRVVLATAPAMETIDSKPLEHV